MCFNIEMTASLNSHAKHYLDPKQCYVELVVFHKIFHHSN